MEEMTEERMYFSFYWAERERGERGEWRRGERGEWREESGERRVEERIKDWE